MDRITLDLDGVAEVRIATRRRAIVARAVEGDSGTLAGDGLDAIRVARDGDRLEIAEPRRDDDEEVGGALELSLPAARSWELSADSASGAVLIAGMDGTVRVRTANGAVTLQDLTGTADVRCANGSITAERIAGQLNVSAANGKITVSDAELTGGKFHNASGRMALQLRPTGDGKVSIMSGSGRVLLALPADADLTATVKSRGRLVNRLGSSVVTTGPGFAQVALGSGAFSIFVHTLGRCELVGFDEFDGKEQRSGERAFTDDDDHAWDDPDFTFEIPNEMWEFLKEMRGYGLKFGKLGEEISRQVYGAFGAAGGGHGRRGAGSRRGPGGARWRGGRSHDHDGPARKGGPRPAQADATDTEEEVRLVLDMLKEGKLSAEEATRLIGALRR